MKLIFLVFAVCFVVINATSIGHNDTNYEDLINDLLNEMAAIAEDAGVRLKQEIKQIVFVPVREVTDSLESLDQLRAENEQCVTAEDEKIFSILEAMENDMTLCGVAAVNTSAYIMIDIGTATQQLVFGGYGIIQEKRKCDSYKYAWARDPCLARLTIRAGLYLRKARTSIKIIKQSKNERIPAVMVEAESCTHGAADVAVLEFDNVYATISDCIAKS